MERSRISLILFAIALNPFIGNTQDCSIPFTPPDFKTRLAWRSTQDAISVVATPVVANLNPQTDSMPEIIVGENPGQTPGRLQIFRGDGSNAANPLILTIPGGFDNYPIPGPTIGDVNNDGIPELIMSCSDGRIRVFTNYSETPGNPMTLWVTSSGTLDYDDQRAFLADFNNDGTPELYAGSDIFQFDFSNPSAPALNKVLSGGTNKGRSHYNNSSEGSCNPTAVDLLSVADCNGDPDCAGLELAAGPVIYSVDLTFSDGDGFEIKVQRDLNQMVPANQGYNDGYTACADVNLDGTLDLIVTSRRNSGQTGVYVWNKTGLLRFFPYPVNAINSGSLACVANVYDDTQNGAAKDFPEILVCSSYNFTCFNLNAAQINPATPYWWNLPTSDYSGWTGASVYDFNGDGISEVVYRDERDLRILYGGPTPFPAGVDTERNWYKIACNSSTSDDYPVVADVDNDGETEIAVTGRLNYNIWNFSGRLNVFESDSYPWVPCRNVWNQFNYFVVNVNDDLTVPAQQPFHHLELPTAGSGKRPLNHYLSQRPVLNDNQQPFIPLPDAGAVVETIGCDSLTLRVHVRICNSGDNQLSGNIPVAFYQSDPTATNAELLGPVLWTSSPVQKDTCQTFVFFVPRQAGAIFGVVNDDGTLPRPYALANDFPVTVELECNWLNNIFQFEPPMSPPPPYIGPDVGVCTDTVLLLNAGSGYSNYLWQDGSTEASFEAQIPGVYWVETTDLCGVKHQDTLYITAFGLPTLALDTINGDCSGLAGSVTAQASSNNGPLQYLWSTGATTSDLSGLSDGVYTVVVTDAKGCSSVEETWVEGGGLLMIDGGVIAPILCHGGTGEMHIAIHTGNGPCQFAWSDGSNVQTLSNATAGSYAVTVTDQDGCTDEMVINLTEPLPLISLGLSATPSCPGLSNGSLQFSGAQQGTPPYAIEWSTGATGNQLTDVASGSYQLTLSDNNGCTLVEQIEVPEFQAPAVAAAQTPISCFGANDGTITISTTGGSLPLTFQWSNQSDNPGLTQLSPGDYSLTLTYADGKCALEQTFQFVEPLPLITDAVSVPASCNGGSNGNINLTIQNGVQPFQYAWSNGASTEDLSQILSGNYQVTVTDASGCTATHAITVNEFPPLTLLPVTQNPLCAGDITGSIDMAFQGGTPPVLYNWSTGLAGSTLNSLLAGTYTVTATDAAACTEVMSVVITEPPPLISAGIMAQPTCQGQALGSVTFMGASQGTPPYSLLWNNGATTNSITDLVGAFYRLTLTDANGCSIFHQIQVITHPLPVVSADVTHLSCHSANNGQIDLSVSGNPQFEYDWSNGATLEDLNQLAAGSYTVTVSDTNGCSSTQQFTIQQPQALTLNALVGADTCETSDGFIQTQVGGGTTPYQFHWSNAANTSALTGLPAGQYTLTLTDQNGCSTVLYTPVPQHGTIPHLQAYGDTITCADQFGQIGVLADQNNLGYHWAGPCFCTDNLSSHIISNEGLYSVTATNAFGCTATVSMQVIEDLTNPLADAGPDQVQVGCNETQFILDASASSNGPGYSNQWTLTQNGVTVFQSSAVVIQITEPGLYKHRVVDLKNGCPAEDQILVNWDEPIDAEVAIDPILCFGDNDASLQISEITGGSPPYFYSLNGQNFNNQYIFSGLAPGAYAIRARDVQGCAWETEVYITEPAPFTLDLTVSDTSIELGQYVLLNAHISPSNAVVTNLQWAPEDLPFKPMATSQKIYPPTHTEFTARAVDQHGCVAEDRVWVSVYNTNIYIPNVILPGDDNDGWFTVFAGDGVREVRLMRIYSRWGEHLFERRNFQPNQLELGWDGSFRGEPMNPGVFAWYVEVEMVNGRVVLFKGDVTVVR
ncbi:MAG: VCBS repeat-containing protein [Saprospiraceae bacterium]|nr:VCBS repeat-containing protein [Saprospiraceae bacterium]